MTRPSIVLLASQEPSVVSMISPLAQPQPVKKIRSAHDGTIRNNNTVVIQPEFETVDSYGRCV